MHLFISDEQNNFVSLFKCTAAAAAAHFSVTCFFFDRHHYWVVPPLTESPSVSSCLSEYAFVLLPWYCRCLQVIPLLGTNDCKNKQMVNGRVCYQRQDRLELLSSQLITLMMNYFAYLHSSIDIYRRSIKQYCVFTYRVMLYINILVISIN